MNSFSITPGGNRERTVQRPTFCIFLWWKVREVLSYSFQFIWKVLMVHDLPISDIKLPFGTQMKAQQFWRMWGFPAWHLNWHLSMKFGFTPNVSGRWLIYLLNNFKKSKKLFFFFWPHHAACVILVPNQGLNLCPTVGARSLKHTGPLVKPLKGAVFRFAFLDFQIWNLVTGAFVL